MVQNHAHSVGSPMQMRHPSSTGSVSNSPGLPDRPQSVENPPTPRTPHTPHTPYTPQNNQQGGESSQDNDSVGGGGGGGGGGGLITCIIACECDDSIWRQMTGGKKDAFTSGGLL